MVRDALIHLTLDHTVVAINYFKEIVSGDAAIRADSIVVRNATGRHLLEIVPSKRPPQQVIEVLQGMGIRRWTMTDAEVGGDPRHANEEEIWRHAGREVPVHLRMQVLTELRKRRAVGMDELLTSLVGFGSTREAVLALACTGIVQIDLNTGSIGPHTVIRYGG